MASLTAMPLVRPKIPDVRLSWPAPEPAEPMSVEKPKGEIGEAKAGVAETRNTATVRVRKAAGEACRGRWTDLVRRAAAVVTVPGSVTKQPRLEGSFSLCGIERCDNQLALCLRSTHQSPSTRE